MWSLYLCFVGVQCCMVVSKPVTWTLDPNRPRYTGSGYSDILSCKAQGVCYKVSKHSCLIPWLTRRFRQKPQWGSFHPPPLWGIRVKSNNAQDFGWVCFAEHPACLCVSEFSARFDLSWADQIRWAEFSHSPRPVASRSAHRRIPTVDIPHVDTSQGAKKSHITSHNSLSLGATITQGNFLGEGGQGVAGVGGGQVGRCRIHSRVKRNTMR